MSECLCRQFLRIFILFLVVIMTGPAAGQLPKKGPYETFSYEPHIYNNPMPPEGNHSKIGLNVSYQPFTSDRKPLITPIVRPESRIPSNLTLEESRCLFYEDQDILVILMIVFPFEFPIWNQLVETAQHEGIFEALAQFPELERQARAAHFARTGRFISYDKQIVDFIMEVIAAYPLPLIPSTLYRKDLNKTPLSLYHRLLEKDDEDDEEEESDE